MLILSLYILTILIIYDTHYLKFKGEKLVFTYVLTSMGDEL